MERSGAARRYANAIFEIARASDTIDQWRTDVDDIASLMVDSELAQLLANARLGRSERYGILERVLDVGPLTLNYAKLLVDKGRTLEAGHIAMEFQRLADEHQGIANARITTAIELEPDRVESIASQLSGATGKQIRPFVDIDPSIVGGIIVRINDQLIDGSLRTRLQELRRQLAGAS